LAHLCLGFDAVPHIDECLVKGTDLYQAKAGIFDIAASTKNWKTSASFLALAG
jgi:hypothetical protein